MPNLTGRFYWPAPPGRPSISLSIGSLPAVIAFLHSSLLLAQEPAPAPEQGGPAAFFQMMLPLLIIFALFYLMLIRPQKKKEQELRERVNNLKENDRVVTIGGIYGVVTNVKRDTEQVTIRVDETNGTKLKVNMSAISRVLSADDAEGGGTAGNKS